LRRLIETKRRWDAPLALAVVPALIDGSLAAVAKHDGVDVLVHGHAHLNHAPAGGRKAEFHDGRDLRVMRSELQGALTALRSAIPTALPVFVPPWNRFPNQMLTALAATGYVGFSAWGQEDCWKLGPGVTVSNAHVDIIDWRNGLTAKPVEDLWAEFESAAESRVGQRPLGLLTHHLQMSESAFGNLERILALLTESPRFYWARAYDIFCRPK
jgi:hypothetical protein